MSSPLRIAVLGCDSSHVEAYGELMNRAGTPFFGRAQLASIWGTEESQASKKAVTLGISRVCSTPEQALEGTDAVMVLGRFPESHFAPARLAIERGLPTFVDKPFVSRIADAEELLRLAESRKGRVMSCSAYRFSKVVQGFRDLVKKQDFRSAVLSGPQECNDLGSDLRFKDLYFYGVHAVEALLQIFGDEILSVRSTTSEKGSFATLRYRRGFHCGLNFLSGLAGEYYHVIGYTDGEPRQATFYLDAEPDLYELQLDGILTYFETGEVSVPLRSNLTAVRVIEAVKESNRTGTEVRIWS